MAKNNIFPEVIYIKKFWGWIIKTVRVTYQKILKRLKRIHNVKDVFVLYFETCEFTVLFMVKGMSWFIEKIIWFANQFQTNKIFRRRIMFLLKGILGLVFSALTIWLAYLQFGQNLFKEYVFWMLILVWVYIGIAVFVSSWDDLAKKIQKIR